MYEKDTLFMRHGTTLFNLQHKIQGWCDLPLTELESNKRKLRENGLKITILLLIMLIQVQVKDVVIH